ncbi:MAG: hypothetical protein AABX11_05715 [Nanoarchaeota archaeon]|mgnify:CR=1 FL=1
MVKKINKSNKKMNGKTINSTEKSFFSFNKSKVIIFFALIIGAYLLNAILGIVFSYVPISISVGNVIAIILEVLFNLFSFIFWIITGIFNLSPNWLPLFWVVSVILWIIWNYLFACIIYLIYKKIKGGNK